MTGRLNGVEVEVDAHGREDGIEGGFRVEGPGARVIAGAFAADGDVAFSGPVRRGDALYHVVARVRIASFPTRGEPDAPHRGTFRSEGEPLEATPRG